MATNTKDTDYSPFNSNTPTVQIPIGRNQAGLTVEGKFMAFHELPLKAQQAYDEYVNSDGGIGTTKVHMCDKCAERDDGYDLGYLTTSKKVNDYRGYTCSNGWTEEITSMNGATAGMWGAPSSWEISIKINGENKRIVTEDAEDAVYTLEITEYDRYHANADVLGEATITLPDEDTMIAGTVNGKEWEADVIHHDDGTIEVSWRRVTGAGETVTYTYKEGDRGPDREFVAVNAEDEYEGRDGFDSKELSTTAESHYSDRECGSTSFTRVAPAEKVFNDEDVVDIHDIDAADVPNAKSHLSRMQNQVDDSISQSEMLRRVSEACAEFWDRHGVPDWADYTPK